ncbi:MAG: hypothetical protein MI923_02540 [Phycisphaerales bacterium]|nr:hypothetical protein [Phycisphaerales bacterium]
MSHNEQRKLSVGKRIAVLLVSGVVIVASMVFGFWVMGGFDQFDLPESGPNAFSDFAITAVLLILGVFLFCIGLAAYLVVLATHCFTFNFSRPFFSDFKPKLVFANMVVPTLLGVGVASAATAGLRPILIHFGVNENIALIGSLAGMFLVSQFFLMWFQLWMPLDGKMTRRRLIARGFPPPQLENALEVGISDPDKSSFKKLSLIEDDVGMLWITPQLLSYRGDADDFDVRPQDVVGLERKADAASLSAYGGTVNLILHFRQHDGSERRVRFHCSEGCWTLSSQARAMDALSDRLTEWSKSATPPIARAVPTQA